MYRLIVSALAHNDLDRIVSYITVDLASPKTASAFLDEVEKCYGHLQTNPEMYERCREARLNREGFRKAVVKNYILVYKIDEDAGTVAIYRFFHGSQDYAEKI